MASNGDSIEYYNPKDIEKELDRLIEAAIKAAHKGENPEQLLDVMLTTVPGPVRDRLRKRFAAALKKQGLREPSGEADVPSRTARARLINLFTLSARQAMDRILALAKLRPDVATRIRQSGKVLARYGVVAESMRRSEVELGDMAPTVTVATTQDQGTTRGM